MRIIPAIDIVNGHCVRLTQGDYASEKVYYPNPLDIAKLFEDHGLKYLHLVDLDGAKAKEIVNHRVLHELATQTSLVIDFGGGIKTKKDAVIAFENGAAQITCGSMAVYQPELFLQLLEEYGSERLILGADSRKGRVAASGWLDNTELDTLDFLRNYVEKGVEYTICTDIEKDGMLQGCAVDLYESILHKMKIKLIASGGVSSIQDLIKLREIGCEGAIVGKAIYENKFTLKELSALC